VWDVVELDSHFDALPHDDLAAATGSSWDDR
jgi:hypothetical protein